MKRVKKYVLTGMLLMLLAVLTGCGTREPETGKKISVYYVNTAETKVEVHDQYLNTKTPEEQLEETMTFLSTTPEKLEYKAPFDMGFQVLDYEVEDGKLVINVDKAYSELSVTTEVLVRAAVVRTLTQLSNVKYVTITVEGSQLYDNAGELVGWMNAEQFINNDGNEINTYELVKVKLYFANADGDKLIAAYREKHYHRLHWQNTDGDKLIAAYREKHYSTNTPLERFVVEELIAGPSGQIEGLYPVINPETKIINILTKDGICYVNLDSSFLTVVNNVSTEVAVYSIVNSLVELDNINKVQILVNGEVPSTFSNSTFERNLDYVTTLEQ